MMRLLLIVACLFNAYGIHILPIKALAYKNKIDTHMQVHKYKNLWYLLINRIKNIYSEFDKEPDYIKMFILQQ
jgi:hypothetical protein